MRVHGAVACLLTLFVAACTTEGELQRGTFGYACAADEDTACWDVLDDVAPGGLAVPERIAVNARFHMTFEPHDGAGTYAVVPAATERAVRGSDSSIRLLDGGEHALLAREAGADRVRDYLHVNAVHTADLFVADMREIGAPPLSSVDINGGAEVTLYARPVDGAGRTLAGSVAFEWRSGNNDVATVEVPADDSSQATITPQGDGSTQLSVSGGGLDVSFFLRVQGVGGDGTN